MKQISPQYGHKKYGDGDRAKKAKPVGYRYKGVDKKSKLYYKTPSNSLIKKYEKGNEDAREKIYFERRADHSDKSLSGRTFGSGGGVGNIKWIVELQNEETGDTENVNVMAVSEDEAKETALTESGYKGYIANTANKKLA